MLIGVPLFSILSNETSLFDNIIFISVILCAESSAFITKALLLPFSWTILIVFSDGNAKYAVSIILGCPAESFAYNL